MKTLADIYQIYKLPENGISDKGTTHSYIEEYERLFAPFRQRQPITILEIGLCRGGSLRMWYEYFDNSVVHGVDITFRPDGLSDLEGLIKEKLPRMAVSVLDARDPVDVLARFGETKFDIIIEDASHETYDSMTIYANFIHRLNPGGLYIIEDVADLEVMLPLLRPITIGREVTAMDFRKKKHRFDDVLITIQ